MIKYFVCMVVYLIVKKIKIIGFKFFFSLSFIKFYLKKECLEPDFMKKVSEFERPILEIKDNSIILDLLWSDPDDKVLEFGDNGRGCSITFGTKIVH
jgi:hypothetical protein